MSTPTDPAQRETFELKLRTARLGMLRHSYSEAEHALREALNIIPNDPEALELYGDVLTELHSYDEAINTYRSILSITDNTSPRYVSAETKMATLILKQTGIQPVQPQPPIIVGTPTLNFLVSMMIPGLPQMLMGRLPMGVLLCGMWLVTVAALIFSTPDMASLQHVTTGQVVLIAMLVAIYTIAVTDSVRRRTPSSTADTPVNPTHGPQA